MEHVTVRDLRNHGGRVLERVGRGESVLVTRDGESVAVLSPVPRRSPRPEELIARRRALPRIDASELRRDLDEFLDATL